MGISFSDRTTVQGPTMTAYPKSNEARIFTTVDIESSRRRWSGGRLNCNIVSLVSIGTSKRNRINIVRYISSRSPLTGTHPSPTATHLFVLLSAPSVSATSRSQPQPDGARGPGRPNCGATSESIQQRPLGLGNAPIPCAAWTSRARNHSYVT